MLLRMWRKRNTPLLLVGLQAGTTTLEINLAFLRKLVIVLPEDPAIPLLLIYPEDAPNCNKDTCSTMFITVLFRIARSWKKTWISLNKEMDAENWYINSVEYTTMQLLKTMNL